jgi:twitching motility protein PilT
MRDYETIETALTAAETGHLVIATLHTPNVHQTIERIIGAFPPAQQPQVIMQLSNSIQGIIAQQLVPAIDKQNRYLAYEFLSVNTAVRNIIRENESYKLNSIIETGAKSGMKTMDAALSELYDKGMISFDSLLSRAVHHDAIRQKYNRSNV